MEKIETGKHKRHSATIKESLAYRATRRIMSDMVYCRCKRPEAISNRIRDSKIRHRYQVIICDICSLVIKDDKNTKGK